MGKVRQKISLVSQKSINIIFGTLIGATLLFALISPNLTLGDTLTKATIGEKTTWVTVVFLIIVIGLILINIVNERFRQIWYLIFVTNGRYAASILLILALTLQIILVINTHPSIGFDPGAIHDAVVNPNTDNLRTYYSLNTNNLPLLLLQHQLAVIFSNTSWLLFDLVNIGLVSLTVFFDTLTIALIDVKKIASSLYIHAAWLFMFPMTLVPYSDLVVLPLVALLLLCYVVLTKKTHKIGLKLFSSLLMGAVLSSIYFIKPSAIIPIIAIIVMTGLYLLGGQTKFNKLTLVLIAAFGISFITSYQLIKVNLAQQQYIKIEPHRTIPAIHFISMGVSGDGGYNPNDAAAMDKQPSQAAMKQYSKDKLIERLKKLGPLGYLKFLVYKQYKNTADGTFAWLIEGHFMDTKPHGSGLKRLIQEFIYPEGKYLADFRYAAQVWWITFIGIIVLGWREKSKFIQILKLGIIGGFIYLLMFEGGRSRYLIQFLPMFLLLAVLGSTSAVILIRQKFSWLKKD